jgi:hypothetical protein
MTPDSQPATKQDIAQLLEAMRDMQTEILRGIECLARGNFAHRSLEPRRY